ncbi:MAG: DUF2608 domain-containing protein [Chlamydiales bacterium]|nr:DUF2608 domain-containing protein [Chlamydiales bacterium]
MDISLKPHKDLSFSLAKPIAVYTESSIKDSSDIEELPRSISEGRVLVLSDIDLTLIKPITIYGGAPLWDWIYNKTRHTYSLSHAETIHKIQRFTNFLNNLAQSAPVDERAPTLLRQLQERREVTVLACTARGPSSHDAVLTQLASVDIQLDQKHEFADSIVLDGTDDDAKSLYDKGVIFTGSHLDKADIVERLLQRTKKVFDQIVMIDDTAKNLLPMKTLCERLHVCFVGIHYTAASIPTIADEEASEALYLLFERYPEFSKDYSYLCNA